MYIKLYHPLALYCDILLPLLSQSTGCGNQILVELCILTHSTEKYFCSILEKPVFNAASSLHIKTFLIIQFLQKILLIDFVEYFLETQVENIS